MRNHFNPKQGRFGVNAAFLQGTLQGNLTANTTTSFGIGCAPRASRVARFAVGAFIIPADSDGTLTLIVYKYDASADAAVALTAATDLETLTATEGRTVATLTTLTPAQQLMDEGDYLYATVTNDSAAITTQPSYLTVTADLEVLE